VIGTSKKACVKNEFLIQKTLKNTSANKSVPDESVPDSIVKS